MKQNNSLILATELLMPLKPQGVKTVFVIAYEYGESSKIVVDNDPRITKIIVYSKFKQYVKQ